VSLEEFAPDHAGLASSGNVHKNTEVAGATALGFSAGQDHAQEASVDLKPGSFQWDSALPMLPACSSLAWGLGML
jgi:hypothetical protein